jgi:hypothetical protein
MYEEYVINMEIFSKELLFQATVGAVRYHCGGWSEEVNSCILISYMVYL